MKRGGRSGPGCQGPEKVEELVTKVITVNYANVEDLQNMLDKMKSQRADATILVDQRTNSLVLKVLPGTVKEMVALIQELDWQTPQVLIEAKIVELDVEWERELGIQWGTMYKASPATGNATGLNFPNSVSIGGASYNISGGTSTGVSNPVVNLPAQLTAQRVGLGVLPGLHHQLVSAGHAVERHGIREARPHSVQSAGGHSQ